MERSPQIRVPTEAIKGIEQPIKAAFKKAGPPSQRSESLSRILGTLGRNVFSTEGTPTNPEAVQLNQLTLSILRELGILEIAPPKLQETSLEVRENLAPYLSGEEKPSGPIYTDPNTFTPRIVQKWGIPSYKARMSITYDFERPGGFQNLGKETLSQAEIRIELPNGVLKADLDRDAHPPDEKFKLNTITTDKGDVTTTYTFNDKDPHPKLIIERKAPYPERLQIKRTVGFININPTDIDHGQESQREFSFLVAPFQQGAQLYIFKHNLPLTLIPPKDTILYGPPSITNNPKKLFLTLFNRLYYGEGKTPKPESLKNPKLQQAVSNIREATRLILKSVIEEIYKTSSQDTIRTAVRRLNAVIGSPGLSWRTPMRFEAHPDNRKVKNFIKQFVQGTKKYLSSSNSELDAHLEKDNGTRNPNLIEQYKKLLEIFGINTDELGFVTSTAQWNGPLSQIADSPSPLLSHNQYKQRLDEESELELVQKWTTSDGKTIIIKTHYSVESIKKFIENNTNAPNLSSPHIQIAILPDNAKSQEESHDFNSAPIIIDIPEQTDKQ